ncbi:MAG: hypothetical protein JOZ18_09545 [Chloroflexi bacterium]|nr:hypothetical protein [Chloroflexota bacterium]
MKSQDVDEGATLPDKYEDPFSGTVGLASIFERLRAYLGARADAQDIEILSFSLHHLFCSIDILFQRALTQLTASTSQVREPQKDLRALYSGWVYLRQITCLLERIEALCQLLNGAATSILTALNATSSMAKIADAQTVDLGNEQNWYHSAAQEQWGQVAAIITECLSNWLECHESHLSFTTRFANLAAIIPALTHTDSAFDLLLENVCAIFGDVLQDFQAIALGDDEATATLLLDLMQKADQLLYQINILLGALHELIKQYVARVEML